MKTMKSSCGVPVASFVLAAVLALIAGPKPGAIAREEGGATGPVVVPCVSDVYNLVGHTLVGKKKISARCEVDYKGGVDGKKTYNSVGARCFAVLKVKVQMHDGTVVVRPLEVELEASKFWDKTYKDVKDNKALEFKFHTNDGALDKAVRNMTLASEEVNLGEDPASRNPVMLKFSFYGQTKVVPGGQPKCDNTLTHQVATPVDAATGIGYLDFTDPD